MKPYYQDDYATIYHGDCREILPTLEPVDLVLTDPPYGIGLARNPIRQKHKKSGWDDQRIDKDLLLLVVGAGNQSIVWGGNYYSDILKPGKGFIVWDKKQPVKFSSGMAEIAWWSKDTPAKLYSHWCVGYEKSHPTQKPVELMQFCIDLAGEIDTVIDPFMGSGTTLRAAKDLQRKSIGIEIEEKYCEIAAKRLSQEVLPLYSNDENLISRDETKGE